MQDYLSTPEEYIKNRVEDQTHWYDKKAQFNQAQYNMMRILEIFGAAAILAMVSYVTDENFGQIVQITIGVISFLLAVVSGIKQHRDYEKKWKSYRDMSTSLLHEKFLYLTKNYPYDGDDAFSLFSRRVELMLMYQTPDLQRFYEPREKKKPTSN